jgi:hypothetical protein
MMIVLKDHSDLYVSLNPRYIVGIEEASYTDPDYPDQEFSNVHMSGGTHHLISGSVLEITAKVNKGL